MSDDNIDWEQKKKEWEDRLASGQPMMEVKIDLPMKIFRDGAGALSIDTATFGLLGFDRLGNLRVHITPEAEKNLKWVFENLEKIPDGLLGGKGTQSSN